jgi:hypothetical protein
MKIGPKLGGPKCEGEPVHSERFCHDITMSDDNGQNHARASRCVASLLQISNGI